MTDALDKDFPSDDLIFAKELSPKRKTTDAQNIQDLTIEQLSHFSIDPESDIGKRFISLLQNLYQSNIDVNRIWETSLSTLTDLDRSDRINYFNAKRFLCFQLAKILDNMQNPLRKSY